jgi:hypothetical protein
MKQYKIIKYDFNTSSVMEYIYADEVQVIEGTIVGVVEEKVVFCLSTKLFGIVLEEE